MRVARLLTASVLALGASSCGSGPPQRASGPPAGGTVTAPTAPTTTSTTEAPAPTTTSTTVYAPTHPASTPSGAAGALLGYWQARDAAGAAAVAAPAAVAVLFAQAPRALQARGCSDGTPPLTCTYADRSSAGGGLFSVDVSPAPRGGWYVTSVEVAT